MAWPRVYWDPAPISDATARLIKEDCTNSFTPPQQNHIGRPVQGRLHVQCKGSL